MLGFTHCRSDHLYEKLLVTTLSRYRETVSTRRDLKQTIECVHARSRVL